MAGKRQAVGVIGLGIIGSRVAANLRKAGYEVWVWNRTPKAEPNFLASPAEVADTADVVLIFVSDGPALIETVEALSPSLAARHVVINHATVGANEVATAAARAEAASAGFLNVPFTGSLEAAAAGELVYYAGGSPELLARVRAVLAASSKAILEIGTVEQASLVKIATNLVSASIVEALAEALALMDKNGVPLEKFAEAVEWNAAKSGVSQLKIPDMIGGHFEPHFSLKHMFKDVQLVLAAGQEAGLEMPGANAVAGALMAGIQKGWADLDFSAVANHYGFPGKLDASAIPVAEGPATNPPHSGEKAERKFAFFGGARKA